MVILTTPNRVKSAEAYRKTGVDLKLNKKMYCFYIIKWINLNSTVSHYILFIYFRKIAPKDFFAKEKNPKPVHPRTFEKII